MRVKWLIGSFITVSLIAVASSYTKTLPRHVSQDQVARLTSQQTSGIIEGRVLDDQGLPVFNAEVHALKTDSQMGRIPATHTNKHGKFSIQSLPSGTYMLSVSKQEDGYAPTDYSFYSGGAIQPPQVVVYDQQTTSDVVAYLGAKSARLVGRIIDARTNKLIAVDDTQITLRRADNPELFYSTGPDLNGNFDILAPSVPVTIEVSAPGYKKWSYKKADSTNEADALHLTPADTKKITVSLVREK